jgi:Icc-related predicted phosphoesterase
VIRIAAVGDLHYGADSAGTCAIDPDELAAQADVLLLAGDLTRVGAATEAELLARELACLPVPTFAVLGNHDHHADEAPAVVQHLVDAGVEVLEGTGAVFPVDGARVGVAGTKGFGGGFAGACGTDFGEPEMKAFVGHTKELAGKFTHALTELEADVRVALLHYAPVEDTLVGERLEIYPFLGSYLLGQAIDEAGADLAVHGHAHGGTEKGVTPGGVHVRNVAQPVIRRPYRVYCIEG